MSRPAYQAATFIALHVCPCVKLIPRPFLKERNRNTWYEPLSNEEAIAKNVHWVLGIPEI
jgi:hypothetical protein